MATTFELLVKAAQQNHGRTLDPEAVREVLSTVQAMNQRLMAAEGRLDALTRVVGVFLSRAGGVTTMTPAEFDDYDDQEFVITWNEETDVIEIRSQEVAVPVLQEDDGDSAPGAGSVAHVSEDTEATADEA